MKFQLFIIAFNIILFAITTQSTSQYKEVFWNEQKNRWQVEFDINGKKSTYYFGNELDAISARNRLHKKIGPILQTARIISIPNKQTTEKSSQFIGVSWNKVNKKWIAQINIKNRGKRFGGCFDDEHEAAKRANQLCGELGMTAKNPGISGIPNQQSVVRQKKRHQNIKEFIGKDYQEYGMFNLNQNKEKYSVGILIMKMMQQKK